MKRSTLLAFAGVTVTALGLAACGSPDPGSPGWSAAQEQKKQDNRADTVKDTVGEVPSWFLDAPSDEHALYAPGTGDSSDMQLAMDKAELGAKRSLADRLKGVVSSKLKEFVSESGSGADAQVQRETERVTTNLISEVNLAGYVVKERKFVPAGSQYRAYVLLQYPLGEANRILVDQVKKNDLLQSHLRASKAFQDLEKDIAGTHPPAPQPPAAAKPPAPAPAATPPNTKL